MRTGDSDVWLSFGVCRWSPAWDSRLDLFAATTVIALLMGKLGRRGRADDVVIGSIFAWVLGLGVYFMTLYTAPRSTANGSAAVTMVFGSIFGLSAAQVRSATLIAVAVCVATLLIERLLFASLDEAVAAAHGLPVRMLGYGFLVLVGVCAADAPEAVGALLVLGLLAAPAGAAHQPTRRPYLALALSGGLAVGEVWAGLALRYTGPKMPPSFASFASLAVAATTYALVLSGRRIRIRGGAP